MPSTPRIAAVLVLVYPKEGIPHVVFTKRTDTVADHRGQISLPGGSREAGDPTLEMTALRETEEEVGVAMADVQVLGRLDDVYVLASNFLITPFVGVLDYEPTFRPDPTEVEYLIEVPLEVLHDPANFHEEDQPIGGRTRRIQFYQSGRHQIWGATARVVQLFLESEYSRVMGNG